MGRATSTAGPFRRVCAQALHGHRARARKDRQALDYGLAQLEALAGRAKTCAYCGCLLTPGALSFDHSTPTCRVADYRLANVRCCCRPCNLSKGSMSGEEFTSLLSLLKSFHPRVYGDVLGRLRAGNRRFKGR